MSLNKKRATDLTSILVKNVFVSLIFLIPPQYKLNIVESGVKHHKHKPLRLNRGIPFQIANQ